MPKAWVQLEVVYSPDKDFAVIGFGGPQKRGKPVLSSGMEHRVEPIYTEKGHPEVSVSVNEDGFLTQVVIRAGAGGMLTPYLRGLLDCDTTDET